MSRIKLSILSLISLFIFFACSNQIKPKYNFKIGYIGGGADGLIYKNILILNLKTFNLFDQNTDYEIKTSINHDSSVYITNVNNTSDREKITSILKTNIMDINQNCYVYKNTDMVSQFFVISSNINYFSNNKAKEEIKKNNTEILVNNFIKKLINLENLECLK